MKHIPLWILSLASLPALACAVEAAPDQKALRIGEPALPVRAQLKEFCRDRVVFSEDGRRLLTDDFLDARIWDARTFKPIGDPIHEGSSIDEIQFVAHGRLVFVSSDPGQNKSGELVRYFDSATAKPTKPDFDLGRNCGATASSGDGRYFAASSWPKGEDITAIKVFERSSNRVVFSTTIDRRTWDLWLSENGDCLLYGEQGRGRDGVAMHLLRLRDGKSLFVDSLDLPNLGLGAVDFSPDGKSVAIGDEMGFKVFDLAAEKIIFDSPELTAPAGPREPPHISGVRFSPNGAFVFASLPNGLRRWNCVTGEMSPPILLPWALINGSVSRDGKRQSGWYWKVDDNRRQIDQGFAVVDLDTGKPLWQWSRPNDSNDGHTAFDPDGRRAAVSDPETRSVYILDLGDLPSPAAKQ